MNANGLMTLMFEPDFNNVDMARASLQGICAECFGSGDGRGAEFCVATTEAMNNVVEHSGSRVVRVEVIRTPEVLTLRVINDGAPFDPTAAFAELSEEGLLERDEGGYGLYLIRELCDRFTYEYRDSCNVWILQKFIMLS